MAGLLMPNPREHVQVWFGDFQIASYSAEPALAARYAKAMGRRFPSLRVTCKPIQFPADPTELRGDE